MYLSYFWTISFVIFFVFVYNCFMCHLFLFSIFLYMSHFLYLSGARHLCPGSDGGLAAAAGKPWWHFPPFSHLPCFFLSPWKTSYLLTKESNDHYVCKTWLHFGTLQPKKYSCWNWLKNMLFEYRMSFTMPPFDLFSGVRNILLLRHSQLIFGRFSSSSVVQTFDKVLTSEKKLRELAQTCSSNISECSQPWVLSNETNYICIFVSACDFWKDDLTLWSDLKILENWKQIQDLDCSL